MIPGTMLVIRQRLLWLFVFATQYRAEGKVRFRMNTKPLLTFNLVSESSMGLYFVYVNLDFLSITFHIHSGESSR